MNEIVHGAVSEQDLSIMELERKLAEIDINLLVALDALLVYRNVTYAARRIGQSQPAMSRMLAKLRDYLGDDLLVRGSTGMRLTTGSEYLSDLVPLAMSQARGIIGTEGPTDGARVTISANLMPALLPHFAKSSNLAGQRLRISAHRAIADGIAQLRSRIVDVVLGSGTQQAEDILYETICEEEFVTLVAPEHYGSGGDPTLNVYMEMSHINLTDLNGEIFPQFSETLTAHGLHRSDLMVVPDIASAAAMVSQGPLVLTVPRSMAGWLTRTHRLVALSPPLSIPNHEIHMSWLTSHRTSDEALLIRDIATATRQAIAEDQAAIRFVGGAAQE